MTQGHGRPAGGLCPFLWSSRWLAQWLVKAALTRKGTRLIASSVRMSGQQRLRQAVSLGADASMLGELPRLLQPFQSGLKFVAGDDAAMVRRVQQQRAVVRISCHSEDA